jgi:trehalose 6-phosphate synthase
MTAYYLGYSNGVLWPVFHYRLDLADFDAGYIAGYRRVNRMFARRLMPQLLPDDVIWVHDYHLIPLAAELRAMGCSSASASSCTSPAAAADPGRDSAHDWLMRALFAYDLVGFQSETDLTHFTRYVVPRTACRAPGPPLARLQPHRDARRAFPIGIDVEEFAGLGAAPDEAATCTNACASEYSRRQAAGGRRPAGLFQGPAAAPARLPRAAAALPRERTTAPR